MADNIDIKDAVGATKTVATEDRAGAGVHFEKATGDVAHGATDAGYPIKVGSQANSGPTAVTAGQRVNLWTGLLGQVLAGADYDGTAGSDGIGGVSYLTNRTATSAGSSVLPLITASFVFNGTGWDRLRGDTLGMHISRQATAATAIESNVAASASSVTVLAANTARKGATIWNDSTSLVYIKFGSTASATSVTVKMPPDGYYEVPFGYTGIITGLWVSATGSARVTELT